MEINVGGGEDSGGGGGGEDSSMFGLALVSMYLMCVFNVVALQFTVAPYGRHLRSGWGPTIPSPLAWFLMEGPTLWLTLLLYPNGRHRSRPLPILAISLFLIHYLHRTIVYPLRLLLLNYNSTSTSKRFPLSVALMAFAYNIHNAYLQTRSVSHYADYPATIGGFWIWVRILFGMGIFFWGMAVNVSSDRFLLRMKEERGGGGYSIPRGGWFDYVCNPNYMGESAEWLGWAVVCWSPAALVFFLYTCSNLVPRARANLRWYRDKFGQDYPTSIKAIVPFLF